MMQLPAPTIWIFPATMVATEVLLLLYAIGMTELLLVAAGSKSASPYPLVGKAAKLIVMGALFTVSSCVML